NRNFAALVALGLGVSSTLPDNNTPTSIGSSASISVNGLRQSHNIWLIDGGEADDRGGAGGISILPSQDAIAQMETLSSNYPPDYGIYGFNNGGPLFIPHAYPRGKTFFFWNEEWRKLIQGSSPNLQNDLPAADFPTAGQNLSYVSPKFLSSPINLVVPKVQDPAWQ